MKKLFMLSLLCCHYVAAMSQEDTGSFKAHWDRLFNKINEQKLVPGGYLWDKGLPDSSVWYFTGKAGDRASDFTQWANTYQYWVNSQVSSSVHHESYASVSKRMNSYFSKGITVLPLLDIVSSRLKTSAIESGNVFLDSFAGAFTIKNAGQALEQVKTRVSAPFVQVFFKPQVHLYFSNEFYFANSGEQILKIRIRIGQGAWMDMPVNKVMAVTLPHTGMHALSIEYSRPGAVFYCSSSLVYHEKDKEQGKEPDKSDGPFHIGDEAGNIYAQPLRETETGEPLGAYVNYIPGRTGPEFNTCIRKPIIFVEGIDFGYKDHATGCYGGKCGNMGLTDLQDGQIFNPYEAQYKDWYEDWEPIAKAPKLIDELQKRGYDLYYLDFHNGADYMENNAMLLVELIQQINRKKCTSEELVIIGASMGGQVARYALGYMEKHRMPHCARTYLSFDSPHQGANIPLGIQYQLEYYKGLLPGVTDKLNRKINRAATRQLLLYHCGSGQQAAPDGKRKDFTEALYSLGNYPSYCRNIALINGSITAGDQGYTSGAELLSMNPYGGQAILYSFMRSSSTVFACYYVDTDPVVLVAKFPLKKKMARFVPYSTICYDHIPGAMRYDLKESRAIYGVFNVINHHDASCFIPSISGLDVATKDRYYDILDKISTDKEDKTKYPFHTYFGPKQSEEHMMLTDQNIAWIISELEKNRIELPAVLSTTYNYGQYERFLFRGTEISSGGVLQFNGNYITGTGAGMYDKIPVKGKVFESFTTDCSPVVTIGDGGQMIVGDVSGINKAIVHFRKGSTLIIQKGGTLKICDYSSLVIEEGAILVYEEGARLILEGNESMLQLDGTLRLGKNSVFSFGKGKAATTGFIKFRNVGGGFGKASIECVGDNTQIILSGSGKTTDLLLQVEGEMLLPEKPNASLDLLKIENGMVYYGNNSRIVTGASIDMRNARFENVDWSKAFESDALECHAPETLLIDGCSFARFHKGVWCKGGPAANLLAVQYSEFTDCHSGFISEARGLQMTGNIFRDCKEDGAFIHNPGNDCRIFECQFLKNTKGLEIDNTNRMSQKIFILSSLFQSNISGLDIRQGITTISCSRFVSNKLGSTIHNGELNISSLKTQIGAVYSAAGGNNTFAYNSTGIHLSGACLYMNMGYNNFIAQPGTGPYRFLTGDIGYTVVTHQNIWPFALQATGNFWDPAPIGTLGNGSISHYLVMFAPPGGARTMNYFSGVMQRSMNTLCYKASCNPCGHEISGTSIESLREQLPLIDLSPSPVSNELHVEIPGEVMQHVHLKLSGIDGKVIYDQEITENHASISTETCADGVYILEIRYGQQYEVRKIIIRR